MFAYTPDTGIPTFAANAMSRVTPMKTFRTPRINAPKPAAASASESAYFVNDLYELPIQVIEKPNNDIIPYIMRWLCAPLGNWQSYNTAILSANKRHANPNQVVCITYNVDAVSF